MKRERRYRLLTPGAALPALNIVHHGDDYQLTLEVLPDPMRDVLLVRFALVGDYRLVFMLAPHVSPFTLATVIAALVAAGSWLETEEREYALQLADDWNERLESWCYVENTELARRLGVRGYYVRLAPPHRAGGDDGLVELRNRDGARITTSELVSARPAARCRSSGRTPNS